MSDLRRKILVVGSMGYDTIATPSGRVENVVGGSANYFSLAASLYAPVYVVGVVGRDYRAEDLGLLREKNIHLDGLKMEDGETFRWSGSYVDDLNEAVTLNTELNVLRTFDPILPESCRKAELVFLANIDPVLQLRVLDQVQSPKLIGLDTMNYWIDSKLQDLKKVLRRVHILLINETEAVKLSNDKNIVNAVKILSEMGPKTVVIKRGEYGFFMMSEGRHYILPAHPVADVIDPTGAGDSFAGGFMGYLSQAVDPLNLRTQQEACLHGAVVASFSIQNFGVKSLVHLDQSQVEQRMKAYQQVVTLA